MLTAIEERICSRKAAFYMEYADTGISVGSISMISVCFLVVLRSTAGKVVWNSVQYAVMR